MWPVSPEEFIEHAIPGMIQLLLVAGCVFVFLAWGCMKVCGGTDKTKKNKVNRLISVEESRNGE